MLNVRTGRLFKSWSPNPITASDQRSKMKITPGGGFDYEVMSLLPYANIHDKGGFIRSKGKMHKYFFAKFFETSNKFFKTMALSVLRRGGVTIRATNYFTNTVKNFKLIFQKNTNEFLKEVINYINKAETIDLDAIASKFRGYAMQVPYDFSIEMANNMNVLDFATVKKLNDPLTMTWVK